MGLDTLATITSIVLGVIAIIGFTRSNTNRQFEVVNKQFEVVNKQFEAVNKQFEAVNKQFEVVNKHINGLKDYIRALNTRIDNILLSDRQNRHQKTL